MGRPKKSAPKPAEVEPEEISQELPEEEPEAEEEDEESIAAARAESGTQAVGKAPSKADMVRAAIADGMDSPADGVGWIKAHYGVEMPRPLWSSYVAQQKARDRKQAGEIPAPRQPRAAAPVPSQAAPRASGGIIADIADIKRLLSTHGKEGLEELIRVLS